MPPLELLEVRASAFLGGSEVNVTTPLSGFQGRFHAERERRLPFPRTPWTELPYERYSQAGVS